MLLTAKELAKLADLCRKKGIESIKITSDAVEFKLGERPQRAKRLRKEDGKNPVTDAMTDEELLFWSSAGIPEDGANA